MRRKSDHNPPSLTPTLSGLTARPGSVNRSPTRNTDLAPVHVMSCPRHPRAGTWEAREPPAEGPNGGSDRKTGHSHMFRGEMKIRFRVALVHAQIAPDSATLPHNQEGWEVKKKLTRFRVKSKIGWWKELHRGAFDSYEHKPDQPWQCTNTCCEGEG